MLILKEFTDLLRVHWPTRDGGTLTCAGALTEGTLTLLKVP